MKEMGGTGKMGQVHKPMEANEHDPLGQFIIGYISIWLLFIINISFYLFSLFSPYQWKDDEMSIKQFFPFKMWGKNANSSIE